MTKLKVGQIVYLRPCNNAARRSTKIEIGKISRIGKKYFEIEGWSRHRFFLETLRHDGRGYCSDWQVYLSMADIEEENERNNNITFLRNLFVGYGRMELTSVQLREMRKIAEQPHD